MTDVLIRDLPDDVIAAIDRNAERLGLSRNEYLRRQLALDIGSTQSELNADAWRTFGETFADLADPTVMDGAWR
ncbi:MAG: ribbon-helix-helix protein, CopG family [Candidatus Nanopelagicales bacterium]|nr:ribbon-helix-helix protein, CopG family [Candidatus Nanopelagicales bacterium]